uniref:Putative secreted protein n=1 Tax=Ixodes ricinus TaxID=34613 RepID=A0A6B0U822_IXORI
MPLPFCLDLLHTLYGLHCVLPELPVVLDGDIAALLELEGGVHGKLLAGRLTEGLGPARLAWVPLLFEQLVALGPAELEDLFFSP